VLLINDIGFAWHNQCGNKIGNNTSTRASAEKDPNQTDDGWVNVDIFGYATTDAIDFVAFVNFV